MSCELSLFLKQFQLNVLPIVRSDLGFITVRIVVFSSLN